ncbi:hypothetical protein GCM10027411_07430 [Microbacterium aureliae]
MRPPVLTVRAMLTPRNRKPFAIPTLPPLGGVREAQSRRAMAAAASARAWARTGELFRPRGERGIVHRRLVQKPPGVASPSSLSFRAAAGGFRGTTARYLAFS